MESDRQNILEEKGISWLTAVRVVIAATVSLLVLFFLLRTFNVADVVAALARGNRRLIALAALISLLINIAWGTLKWQRILKLLHHPLGFKEALAVRSGFLPLKVLLPLKSSELLKAYYLEKLKHIPFGRTVSSLLLDKVMNVLVTLGMLFVGLCRISPCVFRWVAALGLLLIFLFLFAQGTPRGIVACVKKLSPRLGDFTGQLLSGLREVGSVEKVKLILYSFVYQLSEFLNTYILFRAMGITVPFSLILILIPLIMVVNNIPVTVLGMGTREALMVFLFAQYGSSTALLSAGLLVSLVEHVLPVVFGLLFIKPLLALLTLPRRRLAEGKRGV